MFPWNRNEVYTGTSMQDFCKVRDLLSENHIQYDTRVVNQSDPYRSRTQIRMVSPFVNQEYTSQYYVYVNKKDYEMATYLLRK